MTSNLQSILIFTVGALLTMCSDDNNKSGPAEGAGGRSGSQVTRKSVGTDQVVGRWLRLDGGYVLEIRTFNPDHSIEASYYNPKDIYIARTEWKSEGGTIFIYIQFEDKNYPGSYYTLGYHHESDRLIGKYYQAIAKQTYDVFFIRRED